MDVSPRAPKCPEMAPDTYIKKVTFIANVFSSLIWQKMLRSKYLSNNERESNDESFLNMQHELRIIRRFKLQVFGQLRTLTVLSGGSNLHPHIMFPQA